VTAQLRDRITKAINVALGKNFASDAEVVRKNEPAWDSLKHVELIFMLEDEFGVEFDEDTMAKLDSTTAILAALEAAGAGNAS
jgi:acyl carrier protein